MTARPRRRKEAKDSEEGKNEGMVGEKMYQNNSRMTWKMAGRMRWERERGERRVAILCLRLHKSEERIGVIDAPGTWADPPLFVQMYA